MDEQISQSFLPSNWADLDSNAKLDQIMLTLTRIELNHQAVVESNLENKILKLIQSDLKVPPRDVYSVENVIGEVRVDIAHRVGRHSADRKRPIPIVVQFLSRKGKLIVLQHA